MNYHGCLMCEHFRGIAPPDWKPGYEDDRYDWFNVRSAIHETKLHQRGRCHLNPAPVEVMTNYECSHFAPIPVAVKHLHGFIWDNWHDDQLRKKVKELTSQLKAAREKSSKRMQRIRELTGKVPP